MCQCFIDCLPFRPFTPYLTSLPQNLALARKLFPRTLSSSSSEPCPSSAHPIALEPHATDSFQNLLFSLLAFVALTGHPPTQITIVSHAFKQKRFLDLHCRALRWPRERVEYVGIDPPMEGDEEKKRGVERGEEKARAEWERDCWGWGDGLRRKRDKRGWRWEEKDGVWDAGWMLDLVEWEGGKERCEGFPGRLPWDAMPSDKRSKRISGGDQKLTHIVLLKRFLGIFSR